MSEPLPQNEIPDVVLVRQLSQGDGDAFATLFERHHRSVYRFAVQMTGSRDAGEDVTQDVFVQFAKSSARYEPDKGTVSTYLYGIARHLILQRERRVRSIREVDIAALDGVDLRMTATTEDPVEVLSRAERITALRRAILGLPAHYREAVVLCELNSLSYETAAQIVGCPVGTIRSRLSRARTMLIDRCRAIDASSGETQKRRTGSWTFGRRPGILSPES